MTLQSEVMALKQQGLINPRRIIDWARKHPHSELYQQFEWDDRKAAEEYRLWQARELLANLIVETQSTRLVSLVIDRVRGGGYRDLDEVLGDRDLRALALADALAELQRFELKYRTLTELAEVFAAAERVRRRAPRKKSATEVRSSV